MPTDAAALGAPVELPTLPAVLSGLTPREAVLDALHRAQMAFDTNDEALLDSAMAEDLRLEFPGRHVTHGLANFKTEIFSHVSGDLDTMHVFTNERVHLAGPNATTAHVSCLATSQHVPKGKGLDTSAPKFLTGSLYWLEFVKDAGPDGLWKIKTWKAKFIWAEGDHSIMPKEI